VSKRRRIEERPKRAGRQHRKAAARKGRNSAPNTARGRKQCVVWCGER